MSIKVERRPVLQGKECQRLPETKEEVQDSCPHRHLRFPDIFDFGFAACRAGDCVLTVLTITYAMPTILSKNGHCLPLWNSRRALCKI